MSEAAFAEAAEAAEHEDADLDAEQPEIEVEGDEEGEEGEARAKAPDWEKQAHDKAGQAAKERSRRRAAERENAEMRGRLEKLEAASKGGDEDELRTLIASLRDDDDDPISDLAGLKRVARRMIEREEAERQSSTARTAQERQVETLISTMNDYEADFSADHPDYPAAAKHYRVEKTAELEEIGLSGEALKAALARDLFGIVQTALAAGKDPAEATYNMAKKRGFAAGTASTNDKLAKIAGAAATGIRAGAGKNGGGALTWGAVAAMKGADRDKAFEKLRQQERRAG